MPTFRSDFVVDAPLDIVAELHASTDALPVLTPPPGKVEILEGGRVANGMLARFVLRFGPVSILWHARHVDVSPSGFTDVQEKGPLLYWSHTHYFVADSPTRTRVLDVVEYEHHQGAQGLMTRVAFGQPALAGLFAYRAFQTRRQCERVHAAEKSVKRLHREHIVAAE